MAPRIRVATISARQTSLGEVSEAIRFGSGNTGGGRHNVATTAGCGSSANPATSRLSFSSEFFNLFNHVNFLDPAVSLQSPQTFGVLTTRANDPRQVQLGLRYSSITRLA